MNHVKHRKKLTPIENNDFECIPPPSHNSFIIAHVCYVPTAGPQFKNRADQFIQLTCRHDSGGLVAWTTAPPTQNQ